MTKHEPLTASQRRSLRDDIETLREMAVDEWILDAESNALVAVYLALEGFLDAAPAELPSPDVLMDALQDTVHQEIGRGRPANSPLADYVCWRNGSLEVDALVCSAHDSAQAAEMACRQWSGAQWRPDPVVVSVRDPSGCIVVHHIADVTMP